jgi:hypothetical protein
VANNAAQQLKAKAKAARVKDAQANKEKYDALIARMTTLLVAAADKGDETFILPGNDPDFASWSSQAGIEYLTAPARGLKAEPKFSTATGKYLEISWADAVPEQ